MATLTIISWRDIPAQVVGKRGRETAKEYTNENQTKALVNAYEQVISARLPG